MLRPEDCILGTLVECIDAQVDGGSEIIRERALYTIDRYEAGCFDASNGEVIGAIALQEGRVFGTPTFGPYEGIECEILWPLYAFRLLPDERLSIFRAMLTPLPTKETV